MQFSPTLALLIPLIASAPLCAQSAALLGTARITADGAQVPFSIGAGVPFVRESDNRKTTSLRGRIENRMKGSLSGLQLRVRATTEPGRRAPSLAWVRLGEQRWIILEQGQVTSWDLDLGARPIASGATAELWIGLDWDGVPRERRSTWFEVSLLPSLGPRLYAESMPPLSFSSAKPQASSSGDGNGNRALSTWIENRNSPDVVGPPRLMTLVGRLKWPKEQGNAIHSVRVLQNDGKWSEVPDLRSECEKGELCISGIRLPAAGKFRLVILCTKPLVGPFTLTLEAGFDR